MSYILKPIATHKKMKGDRIIGYDEDHDIYVVMMWDGRRWVTIPGQHEFRPSHWYPLPAPKN